MRPREVGKSRPRLFAILWIAALISSCGQGVRAPARAAALLDTAFTALFPSIGVGVARISQKYGWKGAQTAPTPLSPTLQLVGQLESIEGELKSPSTVVISPFVYTRIFIEPANANEESRAGKLKDAIKKAGSTFIVPLYSPAEPLPASAPPSVFVDFDTSPQYAKAGLALGRMTAAWRKEGLASAACGIVFEPGISRGRRTLDAFTAGFFKGFNAVSGDAPETGSLKVFTIDPSTATNDYPGTLRGAIEGAVKGNVKFLFIAADAISVLSQDDSILRGIPTAIDLSATELSGDAAGAKAADRIAEGAAFTVDVDPRTLIKELGPSAAEATKTAAASASKAVSRRLSGSMTIRPAARGIRASGTSLAELLK